MKKDKHFMLVILLSLLVFNLINCQQIIQSTLNLQQGEKYALKLDQYYDFMASAFEFPQDTPNIQYIQSYTPLGQSVEGSDIRTLCTYQDSVDSKYMIGEKTQVNDADNNKYDMILIYFHLEIVAGVLTKTELATENLLTSITFANVSASCYSTTQGFISYSLEKKSKIISFTYNSQDKQLNLQVIDQTNAFLNQVAIRGSGNTVFIISASRYGVNLFQYFNDQNSLQLNDEYTPKNDQKMQYIVDDTKQMIGYDNINSIIYTFSVKEGKLNIYNLDIPKFDENYILQSIQRFRDIIYLSLSTESKIHIFALLKFKSQLSINNGTIQLLNTIQLPLNIPCRQNSIFIDPNTFVVYDDDRFLMASVDKKQVIYQKVLNNNYFVDPKQFIGNQIILSLSQQNEQKKVMYVHQSIQLQSPSIIITAPNKKLDLTNVIIRQIGTTYNISIQISINPTNQQITTFSSNKIRISNLLTFSYYKVYYIPIEDYVTGSNLNPQVSFSENNVIKNLQFNKIIQMNTNPNFLYQYLSNIYQTDGVFSSITVYKILDSFCIIALFPAIDIFQTSVVDMLYSNNIKSYPIVMVDNYGGIIQQLDKEPSQFIISVPFIINNKFQYSQLRADCDGGNLVFASDPSSSVLFILCNKLLIQYKYYFDDNPSGNLGLISQVQVAAFDVDYPSMICIGGILFIYNNDLITAYDYILNSLFKNSIAIPQLDHAQKVILFHSTFIIASNSNQQLTINQYSYGQFQSETPKLLRKLISGASSQTNLSLKPLRNQIEYLLVSTGNQSEYSIYRINDSYSQNQFYSNIMIPSDNSNIPIISSEYVCIVKATNTVTCQQILKQASLSYQQIILESVFYSQLTFLSLISLKFGDQTQIYDLYGERDASVKNELMNQNSNAIESMRTFFQDANFTQGAIYYFNDQQVINGCILGWLSSKSEAQILNRISSKDSNSAIVNTILYNQKAIVTTTAIVFGENNLLTIEGSFDECIVLDDSSSKVSSNPTTFTINIYALCKTQIYTFYLQFSQNKIGDIAKAKQNQTMKIEKFNPIFSYNFKRIITINGQLWIFNPSGFEPYYIQMQPDGTEKVFQGSSSIAQFYGYYVINSLNLQLTVYRSGQINVQNSKDPKQQSQVFLSKLLSDVNFLVDSSDYFASIYQYSDTQFRVQYVNSYVYDITLALNQNQLVISSAKRYYYKDVFQSLNYGISGKKYSLLFGLLRNNLHVILFNNYSGVQNQFLIQSSYDTQQIFTIQSGVNVNYVQEISENQFQVYYSNGKSSILTISDNVGIQLLKNSTLLSQQSFSIYPKTITADDNRYIDISIQQSRRRPSVTSSSILNFSMILFLMISLV